MGAERGAPHCGAAATRSATAAATIIANITINIDRTTLPISCSHVYIPPEHRRINVRTMSRCWPSAPTLEQPASRVHPARGSIGRHRFLSAIQQRETYDGNGAGLTTGSVPSDRSASSMFNDAMQIGSLYFVKTPGISDLGRNDCCCSTYFFFLMFYVFCS